MTEDDNDLYLELLYGDGISANRGLLPPATTTTLLQPSTMTRQRRRAAARALAKRR